MGDLLPRVDICKHCGHSSDWHRLDDAKNVAPTDPTAEFRCLGYDCEAPGKPPDTGRACNCLGFVGDLVIGSDGRSYPIDDPNIPG